MGRFFQALLMGLLISIIGNKKLMARIPIPKEKDFIQIKEFLETGKVVPVVDKCYPLNKTAEAIQYFIDGHVQGKIVITLEDNTII